MRTIDADKLKNAISDVVGYELPEDKKWAKGLEYSLKIIDNAPTVEPEKVLVAQVTFDKDQLNELIQTNVIDKIKSGELVIRTTGEWIPVSERLPEEKLSGGAFGFDFEEVLCTTIWGDVRAYKFGEAIGHDKAHFWLCGEIMDEYVIAWQPLPYPYQEAAHE